MPVLQVPLSTAGAILDVEVSVSAAYDAHGGLARIYEALIDTGATVTAIPRIVAYSSTATTRISTTWPTALAIRRSMASEWPS